MTNLQTCYAISTRLIVWGDELKPQQLSAVMGLDASSINTERKGERIQRSPSETTRTAKTGLMSISFQNANNCFDPVTQLNAVSDELDNLSMEVLRDCGVEKGELQVSMYYEKSNPTDAERDFLVPNRLNQALARTGIQLRITVMP